MRAALYRHMHTDAPRRVGQIGTLSLAAWRMMMQVTAPKGPLFVLIGGIPGSGKSTLAVALAAELRLPLLAKDEIKEALMDALGDPPTVAESQRLGRAAVLAMLRVARRCPGAVLDSTWFGYSEPLVRQLPGRVVEVRCHVSVALARARYGVRIANRHSGHLDERRSENELWEEPSEPLGVGPLITVDTSGPVDLSALVTAIATAGDDKHAR
jgi:predicted kinase